MSEYKKVIALDFDGCLCENKWPKIGRANENVIEAAIAEQKAGAALILWTQREGDLLHEAIGWAEARGLHFDAVNDSLQSWKDAYGNDPRKIGANEYWDDKAVVATGDGLLGRWTMLTDKKPNPGERVIASNGFFVGEAYIAIQDGEYVWRRGYGLPWDYMEPPDRWMPMPNGGGKLK